MLSRYRRKDSLRPAQKIVFQEAAPAVEIGGVAAAAR